MCKKNMLLMLCVFIVFQVSAATEVNNQEIMTKHLHKIDSISVYGITDTPSQLMEALSKESDKKGGEFYHIISFDAVDNGRATADIYRKSEGKELWMIY